MFRIAVLPSLFLAVALGLSAQTHGGGGKNPGTSQGKSAAPNVPDTTVRSFFLSGKVVVDDGTPLTDPAAIQSNCKGRIHIEGFTDSKGSFNFEIKSMNDSGVAADQATDSSQTLLGRDPSQGERGGGSGPGLLRNYWRACKLQAVLPGFTSGAVELADKLSDFGMTNVGTIALRRMAQVEGVTVSVTTAQAPSKATKEYNKGRELERKEKWDSALESFQKAVGEYPNYAIAWFEIGRVQAQKGDAAAARHSFERALAADPKFAAPYQELAQIAARERQWQEVVTASDQFLKLCALSTAQDWLLNAIANFHLQNLDAAEKSAVRGLELDTQHQVPRLEYLLGLVLAQKRDYASALEHIRNYLRLLPQASDAETAQKQGEELERLSAKKSADK